MGVRINQIGSDSSCQAQFLCDVAISFTESLTGTVSHCITFNFSQATLIYVGKVEEGNQQKSDSIISVF